MPSFVPPCSTLSLTESYSIVGRRWMAPLWVTPASTCWLGAWCPKTSGVLGPGGLARSQRHQCNRPPDQPTDRPTCQASSPTTCHAKLQKCNAHSAVLVLVLMRSPGLMPKTFLKHPGTNGDPGKHAVPDKVPLPHLTAEALDGNCATPLCPTAPDCRSSTTLEGNCATALSPTMFEDSCTKGSRENSCSCREKPCPSCKNSCCSCCKNSGFSTD